MSAARVPTTSILGGLAVLHAAWGFGSSFPFGDRRELADVVAGTQAVPSPPECFGVSALLAVAALLVADARALPRPLRRLGVCGVAAVLALRGVAGVAGRTGSLVSWVPSDRFVRLDRRYYGPLCLALASGAALSVND